MKPPPPVLATARVIAYAIVPAEVPFVNPAPRDIDDPPIGRVPHLAIGAYPGGEVGTMLLQCNGAWDVLGAARAESIDDAKQLAETKYPGIGGHWRPLDGAREAASADCSFCGRRPFEYDSKVERQGAVICNHCVRKFRAALPRE